MSPDLCEILSSALEQFRIRTCATGCVLTRVPGLPVVAVGTPHAPGQACLCYEIDPDGELQVWVPFFAAAEAVEREWPDLHSAIRSYLPRPRRATMRGPRN